MSRLLHLDEGANVEGSLTITQLLGVSQTRMRAPGERRGQKRSTPAVRSLDLAGVDVAIGIAVGGVVLTQRRGCSDFGRRGGRGVHLFRGVGLGEGGSWGERGKEVPRFVLK